MVDPRSAIGDTEPGVVPGFFFLEVSMHRRPVNKSKSAAHFRRNVGKTKAINMKAAPMRGGIRL